VFTQSVVDYTIFITDVSTENEKYRCGMISRKVLIPE